MTTEKLVALDGAALQARVGTVVKGKWTLVRLVGVGGMAAVYEARHEIGRRDALKILHPDVAGDEELVERFRREAHAANELTHPGVVEVRDVDVTDDGLPFLVMELVEGESLARRLRRSGRLARDEALGLAEELLDVLVAAHERGVVHRDIKPSNLLIDESGRLRVLDFGVARIKHRTGKPLTQAGTMLGTVGYMPPEQLRGGEVDARADVYATGATLFEMLARKPVFDAENDAELARIILKNPAPPLSRVVPDMPSEVCMVVDRALAHVASRRYPDALTMRDDLRLARAGERPAYAAARLAAGDDPRDLEPPKDETRERVTARLATPSQASGEEDLADQDAQTPDTDPPTQDAKTTKAAVEVDDAPTVRRTVDDETPTVPRAHGGTVVMEAQPDEPAPRIETVAGEPPAARTMPGDAPRAEPVPAAVPAADASAVDASRAAPVVSPTAVSSSRAETSSGIGVLGGVAAVIAIVALLSVWFFSNEDETLPETAPTATPEPPASIAPIEPLPKDPVPAPGPPTLPSEPTTSTQKPEPQRDAGLPFQLPSALPSGFPTSLPTAFPSALPTSLPSLPSASAAP
jgi:serine/threonine-protein kinase